MTKHDWRIPWHERPHVVILGAGASLAAFPNGDANGRKLPLMNDLLDVCGLRPLLPEADVEFSGDFEELYGKIAIDRTKTGLKDRLEQAVFDYFNALQLPDEPTLYDHLVLSLREKDLIATFNWDPFLVQALTRNCRRAKSPQVVFLHGNVAVGYCDAHEPIFQGPLDSACKTCGKLLRTVPLLYPVQQKNYSNSPFIEVGWKQLKRFLQYAYILTIFGYSAPVTDVEAVILLKDGWGDASARYFEEVEIIDIKDYETLHSMCEPFAYPGHFKVRKCFAESYFAQFPRRTCEALHVQHIEGQWINSAPIPTNGGWTELENWLHDLVEGEEGKGVTG